MKKTILFLFFGILNTLIFAQSDEANIDTLVSEFTQSLEERDISNYFYMYKYCDGIIEIFKLEDGSMCATKETYYEAFVFWKEENQAMMKKIDNCGLYFSLPLNKLNIVEFVENNTDLLEKGIVKNYTVETPENVPVKSTEIHPCHRLFQFNIKNKTFGLRYDLFDLTNESKYDNIYFESNNKLEIVALEKKIAEVISENDSNFKRQF